MTLPDSFKLEELAERAGISVRTVRYYLQRGLLEPPPFRGKDTVYGPDHLLRLRVIRQLQERFLPLDEIQAELARRDPGQLEEIASGARQPPRVEVMKPARVPTSRADERGTRIVLAPGVEMWIADDAAPADRRLAEDARQLFRRGG